MLLSVYRRCGGSCSGWTQTGPSRSALIVPNDCHEIVMRASRTDRMPQVEAVDVSSGCTACRVLAHKGPGPSLLASWDPDVPVYQPRSPGAVASAVAMRSLRSRQRIRVLRARGPSGERWTRPLPENRSSASQSLPGCLASAETRTARDRDRWRMTHRVQYCTMAYPRRTAFGGSLAPRDSCMARQHSNRHRTSLLPIPTHCQPCPAPHTNSLHQGMIRLWWYRPLRARSSVECCWAHYFPTGR